MCILKSLHDNADLKYTRTHTHAHAHVDTSLYINKKDRNHPIYPFSRMVVCQGTIMDHLVKRRAWKNQRRIWSQEAGLPGEQITTPSLRLLI